MFSFIFNCCSGSKTPNVFEEARLACTKPNWEIPHKDDLSKIISIMSVQESQIDDSLQLNSLLAHLQQDEDRKNSAYILKNLIILDSLVEQRIFLKKISSYSNNQLISIESQSPANKLIKAIKDLIGSYYIYIKQKAKYYQLQAKQIVNQGERQSFMQKSNSITILNQINICFKIQNLILDASSKYKNGDKSNELIQYIFGLLLKTYLFCHSIVAISLKVFVSKSTVKLEKIPELTKYDLKYIRKLVVQYNENYLRNFTNFILVNEQIPVFKSFESKQIIKPEQKIISLIDIQLQQLSVNSQAFPQIEQIINIQPNHKQPIQLNKQNPPQLDQIHQIDTTNSLQIISPNIKHLQHHLNQIQPMKNSLQTEQVKQQTIMHQTTQIKQKIPQSESKKEDPLTKTENQIENKFQQETDQKFIYNGQTQRIKAQQPSQNQKKQQQSQNLGEENSKTKEEVVELKNQPLGHPIIQHNSLQKSISKQIQMDVQVESKKNQALRQHSSVGEINQLQNKKQGLQKSDQRAIIPSQEKQQKEIYKDNPKNDQEGKQKVEGTKILQEGLMQQFIEQDSAKLKPIVQNGEKESEFFLQYVNTYSSDWTQIQKQNYNMTETSLDFLTPFEIAQYYNPNITPQQEYEQEGQEEQEQQNEEEQQEGQDIQPNGE